MQNIDKKKFSSDMNNDVQAVMFDWAGTVLDFGSRAPVIAFRKSFSAHGIEISETEARIPMGTAKREHIELIFAQPDVQQRWQGAIGRASDSGDVDRLYETFLRIDAETSADYSALIPGALDTVQSLRARGIAIGSTTGYPRSIMDTLAPLAEAQGYRPDCCITVSEVARGRPWPDMLLANALALGVASVAGCVAVDDSPSGLASARAAGMWAVGIAVSGNEVGLSPEEWQALDQGEREHRRTTAVQKLEDGGAHYVIDSVADLLPIIDEISARLRAGDKP